MKLELTEAEFIIVRELLKKKTNEVFKLQLNATGEYKMSLNAHREMLNDFIVDIEKQYNKQII